MVAPANPLPPGCPAGWPIKSTAYSGVQIVWGPPYSRQAPGWTRLRGIGIKMRYTHVPGYQEHTESWAGLYGQNLHELYYRFRVSMPGRLAYEMVLHLPMMGMPPREPTDELMQQARAGAEFTDFFRYAVVVKADIFENTLFQGVHIDKMRRWGNSHGDDVTITLPVWPKATEDSLYRVTEKSHGFEFRTHLPQHDSGHDLGNVELGNLYFIQLLPNELPSYHFWAAPKDKPLPAARKRIRLDGPGCPHYADISASYKQKMRNTPRTSPANSGHGQPSQGSASQTQNPPKNASVSGKSSAGVSRPTTQKAHTNPTNTSTGTSTRPGDETGRRKPESSDSSPERVIKKPRLEKSTTRKASSTKSRQKGKGNGTSHGKRRGSSKPRNSSRNL